MTARNVGVSRRLKLKISLFQCFTAFYGHCFMPACQVFEFGSASADRAY